MSPDSVEALSEIAEKIRQACGKRGWIKDPEVKHWLVDNIVNRITLVRGNLKYGVKVPSSTSEGEENRKEFILYSKYKISHVDGTPLHGKKYFVLRLDSDRPEERARVSAALTAYFDKGAVGVFQVLDRCHTFLSNLCRDEKCDNHFQDQGLSSECLGASDLADDVWNVMNPMEGMPKGMPADKPAPVPSITPEPAPAEEPVAGKGELDYIHVDVPQEMRPASCPAKGEKCPMTRVSRTPCCFEGYEADTGARINNLIAEQLCIPVEKVTPEASFTNDLGADSLDLMELVIAFEEEFGLSIPVEEISNINTAGQAAEYITKRLFGEVKDESK